MLNWDVGEREKVFYNQIKLEDHPKTNLKSSATTLKSPAKEFSGVSPPW